LRDFLSLYCFDHPRRPVAAAEFEVIFLMEETNSQSFARTLSSSQEESFTIRPGVC
jgi:hypothetical protein